MPSKRARAVAHYIAQIISNGALIRLALPNYLALPIPRSTHRIELRLLRPVLPRSLIDWIKRVALGQQVIELKDSYSHLFRANNKRRTLPTIVHHFLRTFGHLAVPGVSGTIWRILGMLQETQSAEFEVGFHGLRYQGRLDDLIDRSVFFLGSYAPNELDFLASAAELLGKVQCGVTYFDVGANVGQHALFMSQRVENVFAFEPSRWALDRFQANVTLNGIDNVRIFPLALGDSDEEGRLGSGFKGNSGSRSLTWTLDQDTVETVAIRQGDKVLRAANLPRMDILKLDVEGYEKRVLKGLRETLARDRPIILIELIGRSEKSGFADEAELRQALYTEHTLFTLRGVAKAKLTPFDWSGEAAVCLPRERESLFSHVIDS